MSWRSDHQAADRLAAHEMGVDDLIDVALVEIGVPDAFRVHDKYRAFLATVQAPSLVDANLAGTCQAQFLDALFGMLLHRLRIAAGAAGTVCPGFALVQTEKHMMTVVT